MSVFSVLNEYISHNEELNRTQFSVGVKMNRLDAQVGSGFNFFPLSNYPPLSSSSLAFLLPPLCSRPFFESFSYRPSSFISFSLLNLFSFNFPLLPFPTVLSL
jgi:hypothetical protein